eukprot:5513740-Prymnesium_polylepis.1
MAAAAGRARRWPGEAQPRAMSDTACTVHGATMLLHDEYMFIGRGFSLPALRQTWHLAILQKQLHQAL